MSNLIEQLEKLAAEHDDLGEDWFKGNLREFADYGDHDSGKELQKKFAAAGLDYTSEYADSTGMRHDGCEYQNIIKVNGILFQQDNWYSSWDSNECGDWYECEPYVQTETLYRKKETV